MNYWLVKSEPDTWSWEDQVQNGTTAWEGVRNYQAANNMKAMKIGDLAFFYHSNKQRAIVGIVEVCKEYYPDPTDETGRFGMVDVKTVRPLPKPVTLKEVKEAALDIAELADIALIRQSRLSVMPISDRQWQILLDLAEE